MALAWITNTISPWMIVTAVAGGSFVLFLLVLHLLSRPRKTLWHLDHVKGHKRLVVLVHGVAGRARFESAVALAREALPGSDLLVFDYDSRILSNASPYAIANVIERQIHEAHADYAYDEIVLMGHSMGAMLLRKALVWGSGFEDDREDFGSRGERDWVHRVCRFVSLAGINRGWSIEPRPSSMGLLKYISIWIGERLARLSQSGQLLLALQRGSSFIADARVQWIDVCRGEFSDRVKIPQTIHLLGDRDDIVSQEDSMDLKAAKETIFVTLQDTGHLEIASALDGGTNRADQDRRKQIRFALQGQLNKLDLDKTMQLKEDLSVKRVVYVMHGIRDYGAWTDQLRFAIEGETEQEKKKSINLGLKVVPKKYGRFPMLPFLLYWDRQKKVRLFMDDYTEQRARFPHAVTFDYIGHSNGTYILASALQNYKTLKVGRVYFAGSVVPKHYPWSEIADRKRVEHVTNVVAAGDWVVAFFPRFFEQIADWRDVQPVRGPLDIGSGGFRGFQDAAEAQKRIENVQFAEGSHSTGVDTTNKKKLAAIVRYIISDDRAGFIVFRNRDRPENWVDFFSNICWLVWFGLAVILVVLGLVAFTANPWAGWIYVLFLFGLLNSV